MAGRLGEGGKRPGAAMVLHALGQILSGASLGANSRLRPLLRFLVTEELEARGDRLKAYVVGTKALGRGEQFDPNSDSIVRVEMNRLRQALDHYYATKGADDPVRIDIPKGQYRPIFEMQVVAPSEKTRDIRSRFLLCGAFFCVTILAVLVHLALHHGPDTETSGAGRPRLIRVFTEPAINDSQNSAAYAVAQRVLSGFGNSSSLVSSPELDYEMRVWPEDYRLHLVAQQYEQDIVMTMEAEHLLTGEIVASQELPISLIGSSSPFEPDANEQGHPNAEGRQLFHRAIAGLAGERGLIFKDYVSRGDFSPTMDCLRMAAAYFDEQVIRDEQSQMYWSARDCTDEQIGSGNNSPQLHVAQSWLIGDEVAVGTDRARSQVLEEALSAARQATVLAPQGADGYYALMHINAQMGNYDDMHRAGKRATELNPFDGVRAGEYVSSLVQSGFFNEALLTLDQPDIRSSISQQEIDFALFLAHYGRREIDIAVEHALALKGTFSPTHLVAMSIAAYHSGDRTASHAYFHKLIDVEPDFTTNPRAIFERQHYIPNLVDRLIEDIMAAQHVS